ncbi:MAG: [protein-PII] uridylyltransferase [Zetaproteobacteria bacterium]|nr:[protein-PII] uridylyltransferase [Zetaproteobacteria bacterium]
MVQKKKKKSAMQPMYDSIETQLNAGASGAKLMQSMCQQVDDLLIKLWQEKAPHAVKKVDLVAVGGYGRAELAPQSDWDLWFLLGDEADDNCKQEIETFLYALWDLGAKIGYAVRTNQQTLEHVKEDWTSATAALEARLLLGQGHQFDTMHQKISKFFKKQRKAFVEAKLKEFETRHNNTGGTAFLMEPDIKECKGGLRDVQSIFWMAKAWYGSACCEDLVGLGALSQREYEHLSTAQDFLWRCRAALHLAVKRPNDRLGYEQQAILAEQLGYDDHDDHFAVEWFMKDYFRHAGRIARVSSLLVMHFQELLHPKFFAFERNIEDGFTLEGQRVGLQHSKVFQENPLRLLRIFHVAQQDKRHLSSVALRQIRADVLLIDDEFRANAQAHQVFLSILRDRRNVAHALREMHDTGVLGRFVLPFREVVGLGQFNRYHAYTVDEHTLRAVAEARNFYHDEHATRLPLANELWHKVSRPELLYLALIFHDIAKGMVGDHSINGEGLARDFCLSIGLSVEASGLVAWLVRKHLTMAVTSQRFDLSDPEVIETFARKVVDLERLQYLFLLTVADISAVGPNVWNDWKGSLLRELYQSTARFLMQGGEQDEVVQQKRNERLDARISSALRDAQGDELHSLSAALRCLPWRCVMHFPPRQLNPLASLLEKNDEGVCLFADKVGGETLVMVLADDRDNLFASLTSAIAIGHINVLAAQAFDLKNGRVLDVFHVQDMQGKSLSHDADLQRLQKRLEKTLAAPNQRPVIPALKLDKITVLMRNVPLRVRRLAVSSEHQTTIEVAASEQPALLARLAWVISDMGFELKGAAISTFGERIVDVFFVEGKQGGCLTTDEVNALCLKLREEASLPEDV